MSQVTTHTITLDDKQAAFFKWLREELPLKEAKWGLSGYNYDYYLFVIALNIERVS